jgi:hypothetical protein
MKTRFDIRSLLCGTLLGGAIILLTGAAGQQQDKGWEYTTHIYGKEHPPVAELNKLGADGWELSVAAVAGEGSARALIFKRPAPRRVSQ